MNEKIYEIKNCGFRIFNDKHLKESTKNQNPAMYNYEVTKVGMTPIYDKRIVLSDKVSTIPLNI